MQEHAHREADALSPTRLASTRLAPDRLGLGLAALGRPGYINLGHADDLAGGQDEASLKAQTFSVLDAAYHAGIRTFDVARSYGQAEAFLAEWLENRQLGPDDVQVGSKWGYTYTADWQVQADQHEVKEHSLPNFIRQWPQSRALLGKWLKVYLAHSVTPDSPLLQGAALLERLSRLRGEGVTPGLSLSGPRQGEVLEQALTLHVAGQPVFGAVQATWNLLDPGAGPALKAAHQAGWKVVIKEAVANGRLTSRNNRLPPALLEMCGQHQTTPDALALAAALAQPFADVVLSGASTADQLRSNLAALSLELSADELSHLAGLAEPPHAYWQTRAELAWN